MNRKVLITGGAGFIGSNIVDLLVENGFDVVVVDNFSTGKEEYVNPGARLYKCDIRTSAFYDIMSQEKPECVIHHAAHIDVRRSIVNPEYDADVNIIGSVNLLEACRVNGVRKVVYASSAACYGNPIYIPVDEEHPILATSPYGVSKYVVEHYLAMYRRLYGLRFTVLRYANVYGPRQDPLGEGGVIAIFANRIMSGKPCTVFGDGEQTRDFIYVEDVAVANLLAIDSGDDEVVNISHGSEISVNQLIDIMRNVAGRNIEVKYTDARPGEIGRSVLANNKAKKLLGWEPKYDVRSGIQKLFAYETARCANGNSGCANRVDSSRSKR